VKNVVQAVVVEIAGAVVLQVVHAVSLEDRDESV